VRARLLGIDTPEGSALRYGRPDCGGQAATDALRRVARPGGHGVRVRLVSDPHFGDVKDAYGRTLAYVDGPHGDLGEAQLRAGTAVIYRYHGRRFSRLPRYQRAQADARAQHCGAWATCHGRFHAARP
jgi:endonuclease YncB( thermonuclease family)